MIMYTLKSFFHRVFSNSFSANSSLRCVGTWSSNATVRNVFGSRNVGVVRSRYRFFPLSRGPSFIFDRVGFSLRRIDTLRPCSPNFVRPIKRRNFFFYKGSFHSIRVASAFSGVSDFYQFVLTLRGRRFRARQSRIAPGYHTSEVGYNFKDELFYTVVFKYIRINRKKFLSYCGGMLNFSYDKDFFRIMRKVRNVSVSVGTPVDYLMSKTLSCAANKAKILCLSSNSDFVIDLINVNRFLVNGIPVKCVHHRTRATDVLSLDACLVDRKYASLNSGIISELFPFRVEFDFVRDLIVPRVLCSFIDDNAKFSNYFSSSPIFMYLDNFCYFPSLKFFSDNTSKVSYVFDRWRHVLYGSHLINFIESGLLLNTFRYNRNVFVTRVFCLDFKKRLKYILKRAFRITKPFADANTIIRGSVLLLRNFLSSFRFRRFIITLLRKFFRITSSLRVTKDFILFSEQRWTESMSIRASSAMYSFSLLDSVFAGFYSSQLFFKRYLFNRSFLKRKALFGRFNSAISRSCYGQLTNVSTEFSFRIPVGLCVVSVTLGYFNYFSRFTLNPISYISRWLPSVPWYIDCLVITPYFLKPESSFYNRSKLLLFAKPLSYATRLYRTSIHKYRRHLDEYRVISVHSRKVLDYFRSRFRWNFSYHFGNIFGSYSLTHGDRCMLWSSTPFKARYPDGSKYLYSAKERVDNLSELSFFSALDSEMSSLCGRFQKVFSYMDRFGVYRRNNAFHKYLVERMRSFYKNGYNYNLCEPIMSGYFYGLNRSGYRHVPLKYGDNVDSSNREFLELNRRFVYVWDKKFRELNRTTPFTIFSIFRRYSRKPLGSHSFKNRPVSISMFRPYRSRSPYRKYYPKSISHVDFFCVLLSYAMCSVR